MNLKDELHLEAYTEELTNVDNRIVSARENDNMELIVCHDNTENRMYTVLKNEGKNSIKCKAKDVIPIVSTKI